jgi:galactokinase
MRYQLKIPARINILGNSSDANEGDFATISAAVDLFAYASIEKINGILIEQIEKHGNGDNLLSRQEFASSQIPLPYDGKLDLIKGAINRLWKYSQEFREKINGKGFKISTWTDVPRQSGLGGSTLFILLTLGGLRQLFDLDIDKHNNYVLAELTQRVEAKELGITCGYADRYVPLFGGIAYLDYRGKLHQLSMNDEPYVTYERLDPWVESLPLIAISSGIQHNSGDVHGQMRPRYIIEHDQWVETGGEMPSMVRFMSGAWETAWRGKIALIHKDWKTFGNLMNENHSWVDQMMTYCGFEDGAGWANNLLIDVALKNGALGAKLTGAGGGGSVFAITHPEDNQRLISAWEKTIEISGLKNAQIYFPKISRQGLIIDCIENIE